MATFKTKIENSDLNKEFEFECYENDINIEIGDKYIFFFAGIADIQICDSENIKSEINKHNRPKNNDVIDLVYNFWRNCYKIKSTNFDLSTIS
jgi:hypothetical protein